VSIVWAPLTGSGVRRRSSKVYIFCLCTLAGYLGIIILLFIGHIGFFRADGVCIIGLRHFASIPLVAYDV
jgi:hypothetical protein